MARFARWPSRGDGVSRRAKRRLMAAKDLSCANGKGDSSGHTSGSERRAKLQRHAINELAIFLR